MNLAKLIEKKGESHKAWLHNILEEGSGDIDYEFLGFTDIYYHLSKIIPKGRVIVDLGCAYGAQAYYFEDHEAYIGVTLGKHLFPPSKNSIFYSMSIENFIKEKLPGLKKFYGEDGLFAICSYIPPWGGDNQKMTRDNFKHCFVFYIGANDLKLK